MTVQADIARASAAGTGYLRRPGKGDALPLVLLHGIGSNSESFAPLMEVLPPDIDCVAWNAPGYGASRPLASAWPVPRDYADALCTLLETLGLPRIVLLGHSLGCLFATSFAAAYPGRVAALVLLSPALGYRVPSGGALPPAVQSRIDEVEALGPKAFAAKRGPRLVYDVAGKPQVVAAVERAMAAIDPAGYAQAVHALGAGDLLADAANVTAPALVAVGAEDVITPPDRARAAVAALPHATGCHVIPAVGHALPQEAPRTVADLVARFIEEHAHV
ncbi:MAG TPA: alpha/beta hydrolase [Pseudolabrys sp.]|nr:alpha/beta hydrolase [Pseudolabrys sp.]